MFFGIGTYFMPITTVVPALAASFTSDKTLIGSISLAWYFGWLAPQLFAARLVRGKARMKPYAAIPAALSRPLILFYALWLFFDRGASPQLSAWLLVLTIAVFAMIDGLTTAAWFDMQGRALTPDVRSRVIATNQLLAAIGGLGVGFLVERILSNPALPFPVNYGVLFACAAACFMVSLGFMLLIKERQSAAPAADAPPQANFLHQVAHAVRSDAVLRRTLLARFLSGIEYMAAAFYVVFAREQLGLPESAVGVFTLAIIVGGLIAIVLFGWLAVRFGSQRVIQAAGIMQFIGPLLATGVALFAPPPAVAYGVLIVIMGLNGATNRSMQLGYFSYAQDSAPEIDRPMYIGAVSSVAGTASLMPLLGGVMIDFLQGSGSGAIAYPLLFVIAAVCAFGGVISALGLPKARRA